jgi:MTH538 TIR-like domain (DUF1863)
MGRKIFISYKYGDSNVYPLARANVLQGLTLLGGYRQTTVRHYVDELQSLLAYDDHINKGECDGEDLSHFKESTIESRLRAKIHDSSITVVMISPNMKECYTSESDQWIPWEISYSLKEHSRNGRTSQTNAMMAIVLPDINNLYSYFMTSQNCCYSGCTIYQTDSLFHILQKNMFNRKVKTFMNCSNSVPIHSGESSYIPVVGWYDFKKDISGNLDRAIRINENINFYEIAKTFI